MQAMEHVAQPGSLPGAPSAATGRLGNALVVEDEAIVAMAMAETLAEAGADEVAICHTTALALVEMQRLRPAILVLDVHLADRDDGWALAELALAISPARPLIVFSTGTPESIPPHIAQMGHVLAKPFPPEALTRLVRRHGRHPGLLGRLRNALSL
jgi:CheY-like chemotaxis protein